MKASHRHVYCRVWTSRPAASLKAAVFVLALLLAGCTPVEPADEAGTGTPLPADDAGSPGSGDSTALPSEKTGLLTGSVTFYPAGPGPTQKDVTPEFPPEAFEGRTVSVFMSDGETLAAQQALDDKGRYEIELPAGTYVVAVTLIGI